jgi:hypothetical protein
MSWLLRACIACAPRRTDGDADELDLLLAYYVELNPCPEVFGELLARELGRAGPPDEHWSTHESSA